MWFYTEAFIMLLQQHNKLKCQKFRKQFSTLLD